jgi:hypothetical protein
LNDWAHPLSPLSIYTHLEVEGGGFAASKRLGLFAIRRFAIGKCEAAKRLQANSLGQIASHSLLLLLPLANAKRCRPSSRLYLLSQWPMAAAAAANSSAKLGHSPPPASHLPQANAGWRGSGCFEPSLVRADTQRPLPLPPRATVGLENSPASSTHLPAAISLLAIGQECKAASGIELLLLANAAVDSSSSSSSHGPFASATSPGANAKLPQQKASF